MLTSIRIKTGEKVLAQSIAKEGGPFVCPGCLLEVVVKKGEQRVHHFSHKVAAACAWGKGESEEHRQCKLSIYDALSRIPHVSAVEIEKDFGPVVADIFGVFRGAPVAIEVQRSDLSSSTIAARTAAYNKLGIFVLWLALHPPRSGEKFSPTSWQRWIHAAYFGRVHFWTGDLRIVPVHFDPYIEQRGGKTYFQKGGIERESEVYDMYFRRARTANWGPVLDLATDFYPTAQPGCEMGSVKVPRSRLFSSRLPKWWV